MIIYKSTALEFRNDCFTRGIGEIIQETYERECKLPVDYGK